MFLLYPRVSDHWNQKRIIIFELLIKGDSNQTTGVFGLAVNSSGTGNSLNYTYTSSYIMEYRNNTQLRSYHFNVVGTIQVGSLSSSLSVAITDGTATTQSYPMTINGFGIITLVGSVSS